MSLGGIRKRTLLGATSMAAFVIGCIVADFDPNGRLCPCLSGYTCDAALNVCVSASDSPGQETLIFEDEFNGDLSRWRPVADAGAWRTMNGEAHETDPDAKAPLAVIGFANATDYHLVATLRLLAAPIADHAVSVIFRVPEDPSQPRSYCSWEPGTGAMQLLHFTPSVGSGASDRQTCCLDAGSGALSPVTLHVRVRERNVRCWIEIDGISRSSIEFDSLRVPNGTFGIASYFQPAAFDSFRAYAISR